MKGLEEIMQDNAIKAKALAKSLGMTPYKAQRLKMAHPEPAVRAIRKANREAAAAYKLTKQYQLDQLRAERSRWQRKVTIATNKLAAVERELDRFTQDVVSTIDVGAGLAKTVEGVAK